MYFYLVSRGAERFGNFAPSIRRVGKLAWWLALSAIFGGTVIILTVLMSVFTALPRTSENFMWTTRFREVGYVCRVCFSFSQVLVSAIASLVAFPD